MNARPLLAAVLLAALATPSTGVANHKQRDTRPPAPILRGQQCLDPDFARGFVELDDRRILVDGGRYRYRVEVSGSCWNLDRSSIISFRGDPISNKVCGSAFDAILVRGGHPCRIERMELISKEQYQLALRQRADARRARRAERKARSP